jgi:hypothetical protein
MAGACAALRGQAARLAAELGDELTVASVALLDEREELRLQASHGAWPRAHELFLP